MAKMSKVKGIDKVRASAARFAKKTIKNFHNGIKKAGLQLLADSLELCPVDEGNLRASGYIREEVTGGKIIVYVGYTADYAVFVHEIVEARHGQAFNDWYAEEIAVGTEHARGVNQQAKFLTDPLRKNRKDYIQIVKDEMKG